MAHEQYPRPDWVRSNLNWKSLNGAWDFAFDDQDTGLTEQWRAGVPSTRSITVPFAFQTPASGINERSAHEVLWYQRAIQDIRTDDERTAGSRLIIRFGAVDYDARVWLDGQYVGSHVGGNTPFDIDLTDVIGTGGGEKKLVMRVKDSPTSLTQPRGKQYWKPKPESIFYTPTSGIWQNVWLESVPRARIGDGSAGTILKFNDIDSGVLKATIVILDHRAGQKGFIEIESKFGSKVVSTTKKELNPEVYVAFDVPMSLSKEQLPSEADQNSWKGGVALWTPENPQLYALAIRLFDESGKLIDEVGTSVGMRSLEWRTGDQTFRLNGKPYFHALVLDQGYWPKTGLTPPGPESLKDDIVLAKAMGFNGCRKHQKVEDPIYHHYCDQMGFLVWGEIANAYEFDLVYTDRFDKEWKEAMKRDINHASIVAWTPGNESWGYTDLVGSVDQRNHIRSLYYQTKLLDNTRPISDNDGWEHVITDLISFHDYTESDVLAKTCSTMEGIKDRKSDRVVLLDPIREGLDRDEGATVREGAPVICTEFGGVNIAPRSGEEKRDGDWGYTTASNAEDLLKRIEALVMGIVNGGICCGFVYTQLTDIEQEVNGLYTFDRKEKLDSKRLKTIMDSAKAKYYNQLKEKA